MNRKILVKQHNGNESVAILENGSLVEYLHRKEGEIVRGTVISALIKEYQPSLDAFFADTGKDLPGYLPGKFIDRNLKPGTVMPLQVVKSETRNKGMTLSSQISVSGDYCVILGDADKCRISSKIQDDDERARLRELAKENCPEGRGIILRTNAGGIDSEDIIMDINNTVEKYNRIISTNGSPGDTIYTPASIAEDVMRNINPQNDIVYFNDLEIFNFYFKRHAIPGKPSPVKYYDKDYEMFAFFGISNKIKEASRRKVWLKNGGTLVFDYTEAMCVVDVNTSKNTGSGNFKDTALRTNLEAAAEIAVQIRLRNIGGIIVIDFIDMDKDDCERLDKAFREHLSRDKKKMTVGGFTALGNYEITRIRKGKRIEIYDG